MNRHRELPAFELCHEVIEEVQRFSAGRHFSDDVCLVCNGSWPNEHIGLTGGKLRYTTRLDPSSALSGSLREKRLELRHNLGAVAVRALNALLFVLTDRHRKGETLATLLAKIFVERHINPPLLLDSLWLRQLNIIVPR